MFKQELPTENPDIRLIEPNINRDALLGVDWLSGEKGRETMRLMGVNLDTFHEPTIVEEKARVEEFLTKTDQLNWMIEQNGKVVGSIWVHTEPKDRVQAPAIHMMIGDPDARGGGVGSASFKAVLDWFINDQHPPYVYSRYISGNKGSANLIAKFKFQKNGEVRPDKDGIEWQNVRLDSRDWSGF